MIKKAAFVTALVLLGLIMLTNRCSTDVELAAPYKSTPFIVGVLDYQADTQFVRINRTFLTEGNANPYANIPDSVEYADGEVDAWLIKYNGSNIVDSIELKPIDRPSRDPGVFYYTNVRFFYTSEPLFTESEIQNIENMAYEMRATLRGITYRASTTFPKFRTADITRPFNPNPNDTIQSLELVVQGVTTNVDFEFETNPDGVRYQGEVVLVYDEELEDGTITPRKELVFNRGTYINTEGQRTGKRNFDFNSRTWYLFVGNYFRSVPNLRKVRMRSLDFRVTVASLDLHTYISVVNPVSQFIPVFNTFSNFDNGALGILGAKTGANRPTKLSLPSLNFLQVSEESSGPCYCVLWPSAGFNCDQSPTGCP